MKNMSERVNQLEVLTAEILQRMDARDERQEKRDDRQENLNKLLSIISVAAIVISSLAFVTTFYFVFG